MAVRIQSINCKNKMDELLKFSLPQKYLFKIGENPIEIWNMIQQDGDIHLIETEGPSIESMIQRIIPKLPKELKAMAILIKITQTKPLEVLRQISHVIKWVGKIPCRIKVTWGIEPIEDQTEDFAVSILTVSDKLNDKNHTII